MPLYEYECTECGKRFERIQKFSDPAIETCPTCGGRVHRLLSPPGLQFKGSGWYVTDYARKSAGSSSPESDSSASDSAAKAGDSSKSDKSEKKETTPAKPPKAASNG